MSAQSRRTRYWRANIKILGSLLAVWFLFSCVLSIFLVQPLNEFKLAGFPLGFWIAQQGTIIAFIILVLVYAISMERLDRKFNAANKEKP